MNKNNRVTKVSIIPSTRGIGGFSLNIPEDRIYRTKKDIYDNIMIALGGRAAEEIIFGKENVTTGASSDLEKATEFVLSLIGNLGMDDEYGLVNYNILVSKDIREDNNILGRAKIILEHLYKETLEILLDYKEDLENITLELIKKETVDEEDINRILNTPKANNNSVTSA